MLSLFAIVLGWARKWAQAMLSMQEPSLLVASTWQTPYRLWQGRDPGAQNPEYPLEGPIVPETRVLQPELGCYFSAQWLCPSRAFGCKKNGNTPCFAMQPASGWDSASRQSPPASESPPHLFNGARTEPAHALRAWHGGAYTSVCALCTVENYILD